jgi:hypothetical protein
MHGLLYYNPYKRVTTTNKVIQNEITTTYVPTTTTTTSSIQTSQSTNSMTTYVKTMSSNTYSSMINSTEKVNIPTRNKLLISLLISLILISLCTGLSYCAFLYFSHYLNTKMTINQNRLATNRPSISSSEDSNTGLNTCKTKSNMSIKINNENKERRSSVDSIKLFRY